MVVKERARTAGSLGPWEPFWSSAKEHILKVRRGGTPPLNCFSRSLGHSLDHRGSSLPPRAPRPCSQLMAQAGLGLGHAWG